MFIVKLAFKNFKIGELLIKKVFVLREYCVLRLILLWILIKFEEFKKFFRGFEGKVKCFGERNAQKLEI